ncbi:Major Facilitator Superfamily protein [Nocardioides terrae]|uniref:Major Facilitator Superfamily protein n=1 Tax=Nocardioides terrae TaxID=574651 RepID=A0A1I1N814_9ACTN|nr:MFS transporter [Nocardioides terrae]SFC93362.1 Major Facilitator Superfamily protein [Nocardioides terrae]
MIKRVFPAEPVYRALALATVPAALSTGLFISVSVLYFTRVVGLGAGIVGTGLTVAGAVGVATSYLGGRLADRLGADRVQLGANVMQALALLAFTFVNSAGAFVAVACAAVGAQRLQRVATGALQARWFTGEDRVKVRAQLRVVTNVSIGLGTCLAAIALTLDTASAYRSTVAATAFLAAAATIPLFGLRGRVSGLAVALQAGDRRGNADRTVRSPLRDRTYLSIAALNSVVAMHFGIQTVALPLWITRSTDAPAAMVSVLMVVNTAFVALFQVRASRGTHDLRRAGQTVRRGTLVLSAGCLVLAAAGDVGVGVSVVLLIVAELFISSAEVWCEAGGWGLAFELADPANAGAYQGVSQTGYALGGMAAPVVVTVTAVQHGLAGWALLAGIFVAAGLMVAAQAERAAGLRRRLEVDLAA